MPRGDRSNGTREALLRAAAKVFVERGPYGARVREIADEAGLTVPALYYHFEGTQQLYDHVVRDGRARFAAMFDGAVAGPGRSLERLHALARAYVEFGREDPVRLRLLCLDLFRPREQGETDQEIETLNGRLRAGVEEILGAGIRAGELPAADVPEARRLFMAVLNGLLVEQARSPETLILDEALAARVVDTFVQGMGAGRGGR